MTDGALVGPARAPDLHVQTFNIRRPVPHLSSRHPDRWETRRPAVGALLAAERPSVLGTQEVLPEQAVFVSRALGERYHRIGHGRGSDGGGEGCPLFYDAHRLHLEEWSQSSLSDRPDVPGSTTWGNVVPRIAVVARFRDRETGARFLAINTHLDHLSRRSRIRSAQWLRGLVVERGLPAIVMGDLNTGEGTQPLRELLAGDALVDAWSTADERLTPEWGTFPNYRGPRYDRKRIDWIAATPSVHVRRVGINAARPAGVWPSDHFPVHAVVRVPTGPGAAAA